MGWWMLVGLAVATEPSWSTLEQADGWSSVAKRSTDVGEVEVLHRKIGETHCLQGITTSGQAPELLLRVAADIPSATRWSSAGLRASALLREDDGAIEFYQHLDVPDWTLVTDRFWVLRGVSSKAGEAGRRFRWTRVDAATSWPELNARLTEGGAALEVPENWGEWLFVPDQGTTSVRYRVCTDVGGVLPQWLQKAAAQRTLPDTVADLLREAQRRGTP